MEDLIFYPGGHPVTKNDFLSLKNRFDKSIFALLESFDPSNKYKAIIFKAEITKANPPSSGPSSTYIFSGTDGYVYHKVKKQIYALNYTKDFATYTNSQGSGNSHVDNEVVCIIFPEDSTYKKEDGDPVEYESATNGQGASYDCHVTRTALYGNQLTFPSGVTLPSGYDSYTTYDSDQSVSETLVLKDLTLKYNNAVINSDLYKSLKGQYDLDHKFITSIASNYPNDGSAGVGKLKVNTLDVDNFKIDGVQHDVAGAPDLSNTVITNPIVDPTTFQTTYSPSITTNVVKQLNNSIGNNDCLLTNSNFQLLINTVNTLKSYLTPVSIPFIKCGFSQNNSLAKINSGLLTRTGNIVVGSAIIETTPPTDPPQHSIERYKGGIHIGNIPYGFRLPVNTDDILIPGLIFKKPLDHPEEFPDINNFGYLILKNTIVNGVDNFTQIFAVYKTEANALWTFNFSYPCE